MKTIWKYPLEFAGYVQTFEMPVGAEVLTAQVQHGRICLWALVEDKLPAVYDRNFIILGTGHENREQGELKYVATVQMENGSLIFHIFELVKKEI